MLFPEIMNNYPDHDFHAEIYTNRSDNNQNDSREYPKFLEIIENTGASPLPSNNTPKREAMEMKRRIFFRAVSLFQIGYIVGIC